MPISDTFNRPDGPLGPGWETVRGPAWNIVGGFAKPTGTNIETYVRRTENFPGDHFAECMTEWTDPALGANSRGGAAVRVQPNGDCYRATFQQNDVTLRKVIAGGAGIYLSDWVVTTTPNPGVLQTIRVSVTGPVITVTFQGVVLGTVTDYDLMGGKPGMAGVTGQASLLERHTNFLSSDPGGAAGGVDNQRIEIPVDMVAFGAAGKSPIIAVNRARRATLIVQASAPLTAGQWVLKAAITPDSTIGGQILATVNFPSTPARVASQSVEIAQMYVYVEQVTASVGGTIDKISVLIE